MIKIEVGLCRDCKWWNREENEIVGPCYASNMEGSPIGVIDDGEPLKTAAWFGCVMFEPRQPE